jgi:hypothetical protein
METSVQRESRLLEDETDAMSAKVDDRTGISAIARTHVCRREDVVVMRARAGPRA